MMHVVTGFPRTGTSMMMRCLAFAGFTPIVDEGRESRMCGRNKGDYPANPHGFYEPHETESMRVGYLAGLPDDCAIKIQIPTLCTLPARPITVYWMHRDPREIRRSIERAFPEQDFATRFPRWPDSLYEQEAVSRALLDDRRSIEVIDVNYADVLADPRSALSFLPAAAADAVDLRLYRNRAA